MMANRIIAHVFLQPSLHQVDENQMEKLLQEYPYFSAARLLLARKVYQQTGDLQHSAIKQALLYTNQPHYAYHLIMEEQILQQVEDRVAPIIPEDSLPTDNNTEASAEYPLDPAIAAQSPERTAIPVDTLPEPDVFGSNTASEESVFESNITEEPVAETKAEQFVEESVFESNITEEPVAETKAEQFVQESVFESSSTEEPVAETKVEESVFESSSTEEPVADHLEAVPASNNTEQLASEINEEHLISEHSVSSTIDELPVIEEELLVAKQEPAAHSVEEFLFSEAIANTKITEESSIAEPEIPSAILSESATTDNLEPLVTEQSLEEAVIPVDALPEAFVPMADPEPLLHTETIQDAEKLSPVSDDALDAYVEEARSEQEEKISITVTPPSEVLPVFLASSWVGKEETPEDTSSVTESLNDLDSEVHQAAKNEETPFSLGGIKIFPLAMPETEETELTFQPLYTDDYFAYKRLKNPEEADELNAQGAAEMRSFTSWLRRMKEDFAAKGSKDWYQQQLHKIYEEDEVPEISETVEKMAVNSLTFNNDIVSETLAEIWVKQRQYDNAIKIYQKLSLLNPDKNAYFAQKILELKSLTDKNK
ncbi:hypothetical protein DVR12_00360 [Chitinophaga silvatica]|uniref:Tetratricopeptide repeat protein n=1 Tax=Chitinophaga silvatica TaxID=2282649 RepID=A0A3E1YFX6_9BACT|nr:hypothetical protein [Chitinophaga silvatica]RFS26279.1 hypothetical protein DVR12_00360 [Chitinophaga silvatica]